MSREKPYLNLLLEIPALKPASLYLIAGERSLTRPLLLIDKELAEYGTKDILRPQICSVGKIHKGKIMENQIQ